MSRPPLANLVAVFSPDPEEPHRSRDAMSVDPGLDEPWDPAPGWVTASSRFHGSTPDPQGVRNAGLAFAQGRDEIERSGMASYEVARLVAERPDSIESLPGDFGLIRFGHDGQATVVRSAGGLVPFYIAGSGWALDRRDDPRTR